MVYIYCQQCGSVQPSAAASDGVIVCGACGSKQKMADLVSKRCPECGSELYAPPQALSAAVFPCHPEAGEKPDGQDEQNAQDGQDADGGYPPIPCEHCGETLVSSNGEYGACPACGRAPSPLYIYRQLYLRGGPLQPIQIKWEPGKNEMVSVHTRSDAIPPFSVLIVGENQKAVFCAGGATLWLASGKTYPLFDDPRTEDEIVQSIYRGNYLDDSLGYRINTKIIFFDLGSHSAPFVESVMLGGDVWAVRLPVDMDVQICAPETLLRADLDLADSEAATASLIDQAKAAALHEITRRLQAIPADRVKEAQTEEDIRRILGDTVSQDADAIRQQANVSLIRRFGIQIAFLRLQLAAVSCVDTRRAKSVACPSCGTVHWVRADHQGPTQCPACGVRLTWCFTCRKYTPSRTSGLQAEECLLCGFVKI